VAFEKSLWCLKRKKKSSKAAILKVTTYLLKESLLKFIVSGLEFISWYTPIQENSIYKKQGPSPISLVRATRIFSKAKTLKKIFDLSCLMF
jgi:hypothetical protein